MGLPPTGLWSQVYRHLGSTEEDADAVQRAVLRAAGFAWCVRVTTGPRSASRVSSASPTKSRLTSIALPHAVSRRDDTTGEMTTWPPEGSLSLSPAAHTRRDTAAPTSAREVVDLSSPDERTAPAPDHPDTSPRNHRDPTTPASVPVPDSASPAHPPHPRPSSRAPLPPDYTSADNAELERALAAHGMKPGPRAYMIEALLRAWANDAATMDIANGDGAIVAGGRADERRAAGAAGGGEHPGNVDARPGGARSRRRKRGEEGGPGEEARTIPLEDRLGVWIKSRPELYDRVLLMETVDVDDLLEALAEDARTGGGVGGKVPRTKLLAYLEGEGMAVQQTRSRRGKNAGARF